MTSNQRLKAIINIVKDDRLILTGPVHQWLREHPEGIVLGPEEVELLSLLTQKAPRDRTNGFSCSARNTCMRAQQFTYIGLPRQATLDAELQNKFNDGTWRHLRWQMMLLKAGLLTDIEYRVNNRVYNLIGSMDGRGVHEQWGNFGFELKGIGSLSFLHNEPHTEHIFQIMSYFLADPDLDVFSLIYEDKMTQAWKEFVIERDPVLMKATRNELKSLNTATNKKQLLPMLEECTHVRGPDYRQCPYSSFCKAATWENAEREALSIRNTPVSRGRRNGKAAPDEGRTPRDVGRSSRSK